MEYDILAKLIKKDEIKNEKSFVKASPSRVIVVR